MFCHKIMFAKSFLTLALLVRLKCMLSCYLKNDIYLKALKSCGWESYPRVLCLLKNPQILPCFNMFSYEKLAKLHGALVHPI